MNDRFEEVVRAHGTAVLHYFTRRVQPTEDAADLLQQTLVVAWRKFDQLPDDPDSVRGWLLGVARGELTNHYRSQHRRSAATQRLREHLATIEGEAPPANEQVRRALAELSVDDQELLGLTYWEGLSSRQIGLVLGVAEATIRKRVERARSRLAAKLAPTGSS